MYFGTINYVHKLIAEGRRDKARAFWEYCYDAEFSTNYADYCTSWGVDRETCLIWISDFYAAMQNETRGKRVKVDNHTRGLDK